MFCIMVTGNFPARNSVVGSEFEKSCKLFSISARSSLQLKSKIPFVSHNKSPSTFGIGFHPDPLHKLVFLHLTRFRYSVFSFCNRELWSYVFLNCFGISWRWATQITSCYLSFLCLVAQAHGYPSPPDRYPCEDVDKYYSNVAQMTGEPLKRGLNSIIAAHNYLSYRETSKAQLRGFDGQVWNAINILDAADVDKPESSSAIVEIYSQRTVSKSLAGKPEGWNREHLWPRSYGLRRGPSLTDLHNIRPADKNVNSSRGNRYFGECKVNSAECLKPANKEAAPDTEADEDRWAPPKQVRGDIARAVMYMAVCYGFHQSGGAADLRLSDSPNRGLKKTKLQ